MINIKQYNKLYILTNPPINTLDLNKINNLFPTLEISPTSTIPKDGLIVSLNNLVPNTHYIKKNCIYISKFKPKQTIKLHIKSSSNKLIDLVTSLIEWAKQKPYTSHKTIFFTNNKKNWQLESNKNIIPIQFSIQHLLKRWNTHQFSIDTSNKPTLLKFIKLLNYTFNLINIEKQIYCIESPYDLIYKKALNSN